MMSKEAMKLALEALEYYQAAGLATTRVAKSITALREALALVNEVDQEQPAQQEPVAWLTEERYAEMHTSKWTPKIQQVFSKDGILESQTIQYAPQSKPVSYPPAQRTWVGLTDEAIWLEYQRFWPFHPAEEPTLAKDIVKFARAIEAKLKEKNT